MIKCSVSFNFSFILTMVSSIFPLFHTVETERQHNNIVFQCNASKLRTVTKYVMNVAVVSVLGSDSHTTQENNLVSIQSRLVGSGFWLGVNEHLLHVGLHY